MMLEVGTWVQRSTQNRLSVAGDDRDSGADPPGGGGKNQVGRPLGQALATASPPARMGGCAFLCDCAGRVMRPCTSAKQPSLRGGHTSPPRRHGRGCG